MSIFPRIASRWHRIASVAVAVPFLIEGLHDGSCFHANAKLWIFLPSGILVLYLWISGLYLWWLPHGMRKRKRQRLAATDQPPHASRDS